MQICPRQARRLRRDQGSYPQAQPAGPAGSAGGSAPNRARVRADPGRDHPPARCPQRSGHGGRSGMSPSAAIAAVAAQQRRQALLAPLSTAWPATHALPWSCSHTFFVTGRLSCRVAPAGKQRTPASGEPRAALPVARSKPAGAAGPGGAFPAGKQRPSPRSKPATLSFPRGGRSKPAGKEQDGTGLASSSILPCGTKSP